MELWNLQAGCEAGVYRPLLAYIRLKQMGARLPPYIPKYGEIALHKLCRLACLYKEAGWVEEAGKLAFQVLKLESFPTLWCREREFSQSNVQKCLQRIRCIQPICPAPSDFLDVTLINLPTIQAALTLSGNEVGLGVIRSKDVEVCAFGPQNSALSFGIQGSGVSGWTQSFFDPEIWLSMKHQIDCLPSDIDHDALKITFSLVGLRPQEPFYIAFYIRANQCEVGNAIIVPRSLEKFKAHTQKISFQNQLVVALEHPLLTQVIPLAGKGCFWGSTFLILCEIHPCLSQVFFVFQSLRNS